MWDSSLHIGTEHALYRVMSNTAPTPLPDLPRIDLDGFDPPWGAAEYVWGPPVRSPHDDRVWWKDHAYHVEILGWFYHDYLGTHIYAQVWDYGQQTDPNQRWQYMLLLHRPTRHVDHDGSIVSTEWAWAISKEYEAFPEWSDSVPSYAQVGADVDQWVKCPEILRFLIQGD